MKALSKTLSCFVILSFVIIGCTPKENDKATITVKSTTQRNAEVKVTFGGSFQITLTESKTDSAGLSSFDVPLHKPMFVTIQIGEIYGEVYLAPGFNLTIHENGQNNIPLKFSGKGAEVNNYVSWVNSTANKIKIVNGVYITNLDARDFFHRFDSLKTTINDFHQHYIDSVTLPTEIVSMLSYKNNIKFLREAQEYKFSLYNNTVNKKWDAYKNGQPYIEGKVSKELEDLTDEIPFDTTLLALIDYEILLVIHWQDKINLPISEQQIDSKDSVDLTPLLTDALIKKGEYPEGIREFLIAYNLQYWLSGFGITPETDSIFASFKRTYQKSNYLPALNKNYNEWLAIAPGNPAPDFEGYTLDGKKVSLKDLRGKVVYIDVWATWCAPCIAEIPASKKLQKELKQEDRVQFLNVSIDSKRSDWENFLKKNKDWKGQHIIMNPENAQSFAGAYKLFGVPDYILIDPSGNIVTMKASRPSDEKVKKEIEQLLTKSL